jgi:hypothetical protein
MAVSGTVNAATGITVHPNITAQSECQDTALNALSVTAIGSSLTYQWYSNTNASTSGSNLINGATSTSYTPVNSSPSALYSYRYLWNCNIKSFWFDNNKCNTCSRYCFSNSYNLLLRQFNYIIISRVYRLYSMAAVEYY